MKLTLLFLLAFFGLAVQGNSQQPVINATGGFNMAKWRFDEKSNSNHAKAGILFGVSVDIPFREELSFETGLQYAMFGTRLKNDYEEATYKANYILLPMLARYHFSNGISLHAGPELGFLVSAKSVLDGDHYDFKDDMKSMDVFLVFGAGYTLKNELTLGLRIHHGLTNVEDGASTTIHNRSVSVIATYPIKNFIK